jgi:hypothetical protein
MPRLNEALFQIDGDLQPLLKRLRKGMKIPSRIIYVLGENRYLFRIFGYNIMMESNIQFQRFEEVEIIVDRLHPKLFLSLARKGESDRLDILA